MANVARRGGPVADMLDWLESSAGIGIRGLGLTPYVRVEDFTDTDNDTYVVRAELPGIDPDKDVEVKVEGDLLTIRGERREEHKEKNHREFRYGAFSRSIPMPRGVKAEDVTATYEDGVLEVRVPAQAVEQPAPRTIPVQRSGS